MVKPKIYLDTTVPSAYFDDRAIERQEFTKEFWEKVLPNFEGYISNVVLIEIRSTPDVNRKLLLTESVKRFEFLYTDRDSIDLAVEYIKQGVFTVKTIFDACHVAVAVVNGISYLASWNYKHMVKVKIRQEVNKINTQKGYGRIEIITPAEL